MKRKLSLLMLVTSVLLFFSCPTPNPTPNPKGEAPDYTFIGGDTVPVSGYIDVDGDGFCDNDDYGFYETPTINGNTTVTLDYGTDFTVFANSGTVTINLTNADSSHHDQTFYYGVTYPQTDQILNFINNNATINGNMSLTLKSGSSDYIFAGTMPIFVYGIIDANGNTFCDNGDYMYGMNVTINGNHSLDFNYSNFIQVANSGTVTIRLANAHGTYPEKTFYCGSVLPPAMRIAAITSDSQDFVLQSNGIDLIYSGGSPVMAGGFIDVNGNGIMDNGDWRSGDNFNIAGNTLVTLVYPGDFGAPLANCGTVSITVINANGAQNGKKLYCNAIVPAMPQASTTIGSNSITLTLK